MPNAGAMPPQAEKAYLRPMRTFIIYKPFGMLSQFTPEQHGQSTLADLDFNFPKDAYPLGRLDADSEGLLLLSSDKSLNLKLLHPSRKQAKTYWAQVEGQPTEAALEPLRRGMTLRIKGKDFACLPVEAGLLPAPPVLPERVPPIRQRLTVPDAWLWLRLNEGKNHQVRKMLAATGFPVLRLGRSAVAGFELGKGILEGAQPGQVWEVRLRL